MCSTSADASRSNKTSSSRGSFSPLLVGSIVALALALIWRTLPAVAAFRFIGYSVLSILGFLAFIILAIDFYVSKDMRKACGIGGHVAELIKKVPPAQGISDLDKIANPEGLTALWKKEVLGTGKTMKILLTGATGYVGKAFLFQLLREIAKAEEEQDPRMKLHHKIYVMARPKARKNLSAAERLEMIRDEPMFARFKTQWDDAVIAAESGDLQEDKCGMSPETLEILQKAELTHVVHCAADVNFSRPLLDSAEINISPALKLQDLAAEWPSCRRFVHCSTAFVNPGPGTDERPMREVLFPLGKYDAQELYDSMRGDQRLALEAKKEFGFPNNYVLTKCVAEHLVSRRNNSRHMELKIVRPAIVGPAWVLPEPGWNGDKPSTISGVYLLWATRVIRFAPINRQPMPVVPVDVVACGILHALIAPSAEKEENEFPITYRNLIFNHKSCNGFLRVRHMATEAIQGALMMRHFSAMEALVSCVLLDIFAAFPAAFDVLHVIFNLGPLYLLQFVCWSVKVLGIKSILDEVPVVKLFRFSDMLTLYKPYMGRAFKFQSTINRPDSLDIHAYSAGLFVATYYFWLKMFPGTIQDIHVLNFMSKGRFDLWWALTHPCRSFTERLSMYFACKILRASCEDLQLDYDTMDDVFRVMVELEKDVSEKKHCLVLTPNHKSVIDFILIKYICFFLGPMGVDIPVVLGKPEFEDPDLGKKLGRTKSKFDRHPILAAFLEGSPNADDRIRKFDTAKLGKLLMSEGNHDYTLLPLHMHYKSSSESEVFLQATKNGSDFGLVAMFSLFWQICVLQNTKASCLGIVRLSFGKPIMVRPDSDVSSLASEAEKELKRFSV